MKCREFQKYGMLYLYDELSSAKRQIMEEHLKECPECRHEISSMAEVKGHVSGLPAIESPLPSDKVRKAVTAAGTRKRWSFLTLNLRYVLAACAALVLMAAVFLIHKNSLSLSTGDAAVRELGRGVWSAEDDTAMTDIDRKVRQIASAGDSYYNVSELLQKRCNEGVWNDGTMEWWNNGRRRKNAYSNHPFPLFFQNPTFQYSTIPLLQLPHMGAKFI